MSAEVTCLPWKIKINLSSLMKQKYFRLSYYADIFNILSAIRPLCYSHWSINIIIRVFFSNPKDCFKAELKCAYGALFCIKNLQTLGDSPPPPRDPCLRLPETLHQEQLLLSFRDSLKIAPEKTPLAHTLDYFLRTPMSHCLFFSVW